MSTFHEITRAMNKAQSEQKIKDMKSHQNKIHLNHHHLSGGLLRQHFGYAQKILKNRANELANMPQQRAEYTPQGMTTEEQKAFVNELDVLFKKLFVSINNGNITKDIQSDAYRALGILATQSHKLGKSDLNNYLNQVDAMLRQIRDIVINEGPELRAETAEQPLLDIKQILETMLKSYSYPEQDRKAILDSFVQMIKDDFNRKIAQQNDAKRKAEIEEDWDAFEAELHENSSDDDSSDDGNNGPNFLDDDFGHNPDDYLSSDYDDDDDEGPNFLDEDFGHNPSDYLATSPTNPDVLNSLFDAQHEGLSEEDDDAPFDVNDMSNPMNQMDDDDWTTEKYRDLRQAYGDFLASDVAIDNMVNQPVGVLVGNDNMEERLNRIAPKVAPAPPQPETPDQQKADEALMNALMQARVDMLTNARQNIVSTKNPDERQDIQQNALTNYVNYTRRLNELMHPMLSRAQHDEMLKQAEKSARGLLGMAPASGARSTPSVTVRAGQTTAWSANPQSVSRGLTQQEWERRSRILSGDRYDPFKTVTRTALYDALGMTPSPDATRELEFVDDGREVVQRSEPHTPAPFSRPRISEIERNAPLRQAGLATPVVADDEYSDDSDEFKSAKKLIPGSRDSGSKIWMGRLAPDEPFVQEPIDSDESDSNESDVNESDVFSDADGESGMSSNSEAQVVAMYTPNPPRNRADFEDWLQTLGTPAKEKLMKQYNYNPRTRPSEIQGTVPKSVLSNWTKALKEKIYKGRLSLPDSESPRITRTRNRAPLLEDRPPAQRPSIDQLAKLTDEELEKHNLSERELALVRKHKTDLKEFDASITKLKATLDKNKKDKKDKPVDLSALSKKTRAEIEKFQRERKASKGKKK